MSKEETPSSKPCACVRQWPCPRWTTWSCLILPTALCGSAGRPSLGLLGTWSCTPRWLKRTLQMRRRWGVCSCAMRVNVRQRMSCMMQSRVLPAGRQLLFQNNVSSDFFTSHNVPHRPTLNSDPSKISPTLCHFKSHSNIVFKTLWK